MSVKLKKLIGVFLLITSTSTMAAFIENEYTRKAEIIKHLIATIGWPENAIQDNTLHLCLLGKASSELKPFNTLDGLEIEHYKISVRQSPTLANVAKDCQILFIPKSQASQTKKIIQDYAKKPILLLGDMENFAHDGGSMNFMTLNNALALSVNVVSLKEANLKIDLKAYSQITIIPEKKDLEE